MMHIAGTDIPKDNAFDLYACNKSDKTNNGEINK